MLGWFCRFSNNHVDETWMQEFSFGAHVYLKLTVLVDGEVSRFEVLK